ncbi:tRNA lysidine(34) synthetase TilS [Pseudoalteromonas fenneropenaei]|uniref:tRNA(Ile)-lysidine synthase n=1 Tax=Pseudoalteromonas fenneropenaei TaxID=1737459 RepID=A0ABV7CMQ0_9GAMM
MVSSALTQSAIYRALEVELIRFMQQETDCQGLTLALSGGADSMLLLNLYGALCQSHGIAFEAIYVHHGLSPNASAWQAHCAAACQTLQVPFQAVSVTVHKVPRQSLEEQARELRYQALDTNASPNHALVFGHHANDQLETFLLRLQRGAGLDGLAAMASKRRLASGRLCFRPLLEVTRSEIEQLLALANIAHIEDESNQDDSYSRNFLRNRVIPLWQSVQPGLLTSVTRAAALLREQSELLAEYSQLDLQQCLQQQHLRLSPLAAMSRARQANVVRAFLAFHGLKMPSQAVLNQILDQALGAKADAELAIQVGRASEFAEQAIMLRRYRQSLFVVKPQADLADFNWPDMPSYTLPDGRTLQREQGTGMRLPQDDEIVSIRFDVPLLRIHLAHKPGSNTIKHWLKDAGVAPWLRPRVPVVFYNETPVQIIGVGFSHAHARLDGVQWRCIAST